MKTMSYCRFSASLRPLLLNSQESLTSKHVLQLLCCCLVGIFLLAQTSLPASATVLTFEVFDPEIPQFCCLFMPETYGDRVASAGPDANLHVYGEGNGFTPNVEVLYDSELEGWFYYNEPPPPPPSNEWHGVLAGFYLHEVVRDMILPITFTPDTGFGVIVNSFQLDDYKGYDRVGEGFPANHHVDWTIYKDSVGPGNVIVSGGVDVIADGPNVLVNTGMTAAHFGVVIFEFTHTLGAWDDVAVDDLNFDQVAAPAGVPGDFNEDDKVDAADYALWRKNDTANNSLPNDDGLATQAERYTLWRANFGEMAMPGSGTGLGTVPEPTGAVLAALGLLAIAACQRNRRRPMSAQKSFETLTSLVAFSGRTKP